MYLILPENLFITEKYGKTTSKDSYINCILSKNKQTKQQKGNKFSVKTFQPINSN